MPRLFHRPPKYSLHKGTRQTVVSLDDAVRFLRKHHATMFLEDFLALACGYAGGERADMMLFTVEELEQLAAELKQGTVSLVTRSSRRKVYDHTTDLSRDRNQQ